MNTNTTITISKETAEVLRSMKNHPRETMADVVKRLAGIQEVPYVEQAETAQRSQ